VEVDSASHGSVEAIRDLVSQALYSGGGYWRVFVLDEVHSVSQAGFQALLKTLEEPPPRTSFCLVTTEADRIPETIMARAMFFRFQKISLAGLTERLSFVAGAEEIPVTGDALAWIARFANGGMRDALMTLDQVSRLGAEVTVPLLEQVFGYADPTPLLEAMLSGNAAKAILVSEELVGRFGNVASLIDRMVVVLRDDVVSGSSRFGLSMAEHMDLLRSVWEFRIRIRGLRVDDRAALAGMVAQLARRVGEVPVEAPANLDAVFGVRSS